MDLYSGSGSWTMISTMPTHTNSPASSNQDHLFHSPQQHEQQFYQQPQFPQQQQFQHRTLQQQQQQQQNQHHQSVASHFHLLQLVENLANAIENGTRDRHSDALVSELNNHFEKCQQPLNSIAGSISSRAMLRGRSESWRRVNSY